VVSKPASLPIQLTANTAPMPSRTTPRIMAIRLAVTMSKRR
jgi:hypothetical protein